MKRIDELFQTSDWKKEKHVPLIECPDSASSGTLFDIKVSVGKEVSHPHTTEHHIRWIQLFFQPQDEKVCYQIANIELSAHGESTAGPNEGPVNTHHAASVSAMLKKSGTLYATCFCNIHGLWESSKEITVQ